MPAPFRAAGATRPAGRGRRSRAFTDPAMIVGGRAATRKMSPVYKTKLFERGLPPLSHGARCKMPRPARPLELRRAQCDIRTYAPAIPKSALAGLARGA